MLSLTDATVADILRERFEIVAELVAIGAELAAIEQQVGVGATPDLAAARAWQQRLCLQMLLQLLMESCAWRVRAETTTVH